MATIIIRNLSKKVVARLAARARANKRSLEAELREILTAAARAGAAFDLHARARRIAAMTPAVSQSDSRVLLREDRQR
jgi:antitoxin FitA